MPHKYWCKESVVNQLRKSILELGRIPTEEEYSQLGISPAISTIRRYNMSWGQAMRLAGFDVLKVDFLPKGVITQLLKQYIQDRNNVLNSSRYEKEYRQLDLPSPKAIINHFGSWEAAAKAVGAETVYQKWGHFSNEKLLSLLRNYFREVGRAPYQMEWDEHAKEKGLPGKDVFANRFLSWNNALKLAGLPLSRVRKSRWDKDTILEAIRENRNLFPEIPTRKNYNKIKKGNKKLPPAVIITRFYKSFYEPFILAGIPGEIPRTGRSKEK